jgi:pimeloyl-ACP methyl ester carboxylesterase
MKVHAVRGGGGLRLHVREWRKADGPPILFIHGWSQTISAGRSSTKVRSPTNFDSLPMTSVVTACPRDPRQATGARERPRPGPGPSALTS